MLWMEIAWADVGVHEIAGAKANPTIIDYFREVHRPDITSDEVAWCAAFVGACLSRAGVVVGLPEGEELLASSYLKFGTALDKAKPRVGAIAVTRRSGGSGYHVAFVAGWNDTHIKLLGGNQSDSVSEAWFARSSVVALRWPPIAATPATLAKQGSRIVGAANQQKKDGTKAGVVEVVDVANEAFGFNELAAKAQQTMADYSTIEQFGLFVVGKGKWIAGALALYWLGRMAWNSSWIKHWRAEDANTGKTIS